MKACLLSAALLLLAASQGRANLIVNGSFENFTTSGAPNDTSFGNFIRFFGPPDTASNTELTGWTITGSSGGNPNNVDLVNSSLYPAFAGNWSLDMEGNVGASGVIQQSFATTPGQLYQLSFAYGNNPSGSGGTMQVLVTGNGTLLDDSVSHNTSSAANMNYNLFSADFTADSSTTTLQFEATTNSGFGVVLDAVEVDPIPEPASLTAWALAAAGLAGWRWRKGKRATA